MARFCTQCGVEAGAADRFCGSCGGSLSGEGPAGVAGQSEAIGGAPGVPTQPVRAAGSSTVQQPVPMDPSAGPTGAAIWWSEPQHRMGAAVLGAVVVLAVVLGAVLASSGGGGGTAGISHAASSTTAGSTTTTLSPAQVKAIADYRDYVTRLENILQQSAAGRGQVGSLVSGVENGCQVLPEDASAQFARSSITGRAS